MKKLILSILLSVGIMSVIPLSSAMAAADGTSYIAGTISSNGSPVSGASVTVTCNSNVLTSTTTVAGGYLVQFTSVQCPSGSTASVAATKGSMSGTSSGTVNNLTSEPTVINLAIVNVSVVPEFGIITGASALVFGGGAFMLVRRRNTLSHKS